MTRWPDQQRLPEILGETSVALAATSAVLIVVVRDWRERRRKVRRAAARLAFRTAAI